MKVNIKQLQRLRLIGFAEGISTLVLFGIAMPLKYLADLPLAVKIVGSIHGILFIALILAFVYAVDHIPISKKLACLGVLSAIIPFGPFVLDRKLQKLKDK